jgi:deoxyribonuclease V
MDVKELFKEQLELSKRSSLKDSFGQINRIGGVDCSYLGDEFIIAGLVVLEYNNLKPFYRTFEVQKLTFPYIPGLLAYREADAIIKVIGEAKVKPDIIMIDGFGTNHPRRCGIATQVGIELDMPAIGVGKSFLCGKIKGDDIYQGDEKVGKVLHSIQYPRPIYVSPGHRISLDTSVKVVKHCIKSHRLPEPARLAHEYVTMLKKRLLLKKK